jgi:hypothetical protein
LEFTQKIKKDFTLTIDGYNQGTRKYLICNNNAFQGGVSTGDRTSFWGRKEKNSQTSGLTPGIFFPQVTLHFRFA